MVDAPDYSRYVKPVKTLLGEGQSRYMAVAGDAVPAGGSYKLTITVSSEYKFTVAIIIVTCEASCIQRTDYGLVVNGADTTYGRFYFDISKTIPYPELSTYVFDPGETFFIKVYNQDSEDRRMYITITGTLEKVRA